ncbi:hypothetical protein M2418_003654 [Rhizobium sp. BIGb0125]|nr:hypothetical protein [Rhizobium sp. BIGb0125]
MRTLCCTLNSSAAPQPLQRRESEANYCKPPVPQESSNGTIALLTPSPVHKAATIGRGSFACTTKIRIMHATRAISRFRDNDMEII